MRSLSNAKIADWIRRRPALKSAVKFFYKFIMFPFTRNGIGVNIGGAGVYRIDCAFALSRYEYFGERHNAGFGRWIECCKDARQVFDIGAHIGLYTLPASGVIAEKGMVYAFEPSKVNGSYIRRHLKYNHITNVVVLPYLVGEEMKRERIFYENTRVDATNSLNPKKDVKRYKKVCREQITLDNFIRERNIKPEVIKIDVEGAEYNVLKGAAEVVRACSPIIFLSVHPRQLLLFRSSVDALEKIISDLGYRMQDCGGNKVNEIEFGEYVLLPARVSNIKEWRRCHLKR